MNEANGFIFLMIATGFFGFFSLIGTCMAVGDNEDYAGFMVAVTIFLLVAFLVSGFLGFSGYNI